MKEIDTSHMFMAYVCKKAGVTPTTTLQCIVCVEDGRPIAGALYDLYNTVSIHCHIWVEGTPSRAWYAAIFDYPFNQLQLHKLIGHVYSSNMEARKLDEHFGFVVEATIKDFSPEGDLLIYTMTREQCKIINDPKWQRIIETELKEAA
jgi:RimJ/RimL family protein N-acetyltransferase